MDSLPPEIIEQIIGLLRNDNSALRACSLISHRFVPSCQHHLFSHIELLPPFSKRAIRTSGIRFMQIIQSSPHLQSYVKHLDIINSELTQRTSGWLVDDAALGITLPLLQNLRAIAVGGDDLIRWRALSPSLRAGLDATFRSGFLVYIKLEKFRIFPISIIQHCQALKQLVLEDIEIEYDYHPENELDLTYSNTNPLHAKLDTLHISVYIPFTVQSVGVSSNHSFNPFYSLDVTALRRIHLVIDEDKPDNRELFCSLLLACSSTLQELSLVMHLLLDQSFFDFSIYPIHLGLLPHLKKLRISSEEYPDYEPRNALLSVVRFLETVQPANTIQYLTLEICMIPPLSEVDAYFIPEFEEPWHQLDDLLTSERYQHLREIKLQYYYHGHVAPENIRRRFERILSTLCSEDMFELEIFPGVYKTKTFFYPIEELV